MPESGDGLNLRLSKNGGKSEEKPGDHIREAEDILFDEPILVRVTRGDSGKRLDAFLRDALAGITSDPPSRTLIAKLIKEKAVTLLDESGTSCFQESSPEEFLLKPSTKVRAREIYRIVLPLPVEIDAEPEDIPVEVIHEDRDIMVVNKPRGMVVHPAPGSWNGTLVNALLFRMNSNKKIPNEAVQSDILSSDSNEGLSSIGGKLRPGIVHRLDKETSGLIVIAKNDMAHQRLSNMFARREIKKTYFGIVHGIVKEKRFKVDAPIGRSQSDRKKMAVVRNENSRDALTDFELLETFGPGEKGERGYSLLKIMPRTGRTHQIRVHLNHIGHPLVGDRVYGLRKFTVFDEMISGQALHAGKIEFPHPGTGLMVSFEVSMPADMLSIVEAMRCNMV